MLDRPTRRAALAAALTQYPPGYHIGRRMSDGEVAVNALFIGFVLIGFFSWMFG